MVIPPMFRPECCVVVLRPEEDQTILVKTSVAFPDHFKLVSKNPTICKHIHSCRLPHIAFQFSMSCFVSSPSRIHPSVSPYMHTHTQQLMVQLREHQKRCELLQEQEEEMRKQLSLYSEKFEEFQETLSKSNSVFATFKKEMDKVRSLPA